MKILIDAGHGPKGSGARGILDEATETRAVAYPLIEYLKGLGHEVHDVTVADNYRQIQRRVKNINSYANVDLVVSIHHNASGGAGHGTEILYRKTQMATISNRILQNMSDLGFRNRGTKYRTNLGILNGSHHPIILVECLFIDNQSDVNLYHQVTPSGVAKAIAEGITGQTVGDLPTSPDNPTAPSEPVVPPHIQVYESAYDRVKAFILGRGGTAPQKRFMDKMTRAEAFSLLNRMTDKKYDDDLCAYFPELCWSDDPYEPPITEPIPPPNTPPPPNLPPSSGSGETQGERIVRYAKAYIGMPYQWGGKIISDGEPGDRYYKSSYYGVDCSGFTYGVLKDQGLQSDYLQSFKAFEWCKEISKPRIGDLVFYGRPVHHLGFFVGDGKTISASGSGPTITSVAKAKREGAQVKIHNTYYMKNVRFGRPPTYEP